jgi:hypothetical protein
MWGFEQGALDTNTAVCPIEFLQGSKFLQDTKKDAQDAQALVSGY